MHRAPPPTFLQGFERELERRVGSILKLTLVKEPEISDVLLVDLTLVSRRWIHCPSQVSSVSDAMPLIIHSWRWEMKPFQNAVVEVLPNISPEKAVLESVDQPPAALSKLKGINIAAGHDRLQGNPGRDCTTVNREVDVALFPSQSTSTTRFVVKCFVKGIPSKNLVDWRNISTAALVSPRRDPHQSSQPPHHHLRDPDWSTACGRSETPLPTARNPPGQVRRSTTP